MQKLNYYSPWKNFTILMILFVAVIYTLKSADSNIEKMGNLINN